MKKNTFGIKILAGAFMACLLAIATFSVKAGAEEAATTVDIGVTDYEALTMEIIKNGNNIIYASTDNKKTFAEVEGQTVDGKLIMDISFASKDSDVTIWLKGDEDSKVIKVVLPKASSSLKAKYDKAGGTVVLSGYDNQTHFRWHKSTDSNYKTVAIDANDPSNKEFVNDIENLRIKGGKICISLVGVNGTGIDNMGRRPGKEVTVSITKKNTAPNIKLNYSKLTFNTKATMEYKIVGSGDGWKKCTKNMPLSEIAPEALAENGSRTVSIKFRTAQTSSKPASLESFVTVKGQRKGPSIGTSGTNVIISKEEGKNNKAGKTLVTFVTAAKTNPIDYKIVKPGETPDYTKGWKTVKKEGDIKKFSERQLPAGSKVLVRYSKVNDNVSKGITGEMASAYNSYTVN
ncbi:MAG: hypothetical protein K5655_10485 [Lachnospiraceae bacterium]|nr:hypothetical protein [Lachnospiraceae bacterium]